ncbi:MAG: hypothetical protein FWC53_00725 [Firmicutes bacterium]|nr:hypothetical protein [Bacillota bacterium]
MGRKIVSSIASIIIIIILISILVFLYQTYKAHYFNGFIRAVGSQELSTFSRDNKITSGGYDYSYKIDSKDYNDAVFYKEVSVKPGTPYLVKCMVKTEDVATADGRANAGAQIGIEDTVECSESIVGTNGWQELDFMFNSKNRTSVKIGFRLGGNAQNCKGTAWFSDFTLEQGVAKTDTNWNMALFIFKNVDVNINQNGISQEKKLSMSSSDISTMKDNMVRFQKSCAELSNNQMSVTYDIYVIDDPITSVSHSDEFGYYVDWSDVQSILKGYVNGKEYEHIFVAVTLGDQNTNNSIPVSDWIGLRRNDCI